MFLVAWQPLGIRGEPGTGTGGNDTPFSFAAWTAQTDAPTRNTLANALIDRNNPRVIDLSEGVDLDTLPDDKLVPAKYLKDKFAPLDSPILTGDPLAPTKGINDGTDSIATCAYVKNNLDYLTTPRMVGEMVQIMLTRSQLPEGQVIYEDPSSGWLYHVVLHTETGVTNEIGNSLSNALLARDDLFPYFEYWWHILGNSNQFVSSIRLSNGTVSTRGVSAQADWDANKKLRFSGNTSCFPYYTKPHSSGKRGHFPVSSGTTLYTINTVLLFFTGVRN